MTDETKTETEAPAGSLLNQVQPTSTDPGAEPVAAQTEVPVEDGGGASPAPEPAPAAEAEPLTVDALKLPEGAAPDPEALTSYVEFANAQGLNVEQAQAALDLHAQTLTQFSAHMQQEWENTQNAWQEQCRALPDIGGDKLEPALGQIAQVVERYGSKELREALDVTGAGNHPAVVQFLHRISKVVNEAPPVSGQPTATAPTSRAERMFKGA